MHVCYNTYNDKNGYFTDLATNMILISIPILKTLSYLIQPNITNIKDKDFPTKSLFRCHQDVSYRHFTTSLKNTLK